MLTKITLANYLDEARCRDKDIASERKARL
jgi:hypothetical protein